MALFNPNQFRQQNPLNQLPTLESNIIGGVTRSAEGTLLNLLGLGGPPGKTSKVGAAITTFDVSGFTSNLNKHNETSRADKFYVMIPAPPILADTKVGGFAGSGAMKDLAFQIETAEIPGRDMGMIEYRQHVFMNRNPHMNIFQPASFTIINTGDLWEKYFFEQWMSGMIPMDTGMAEYMEDDGGPNFEVDIAIFQLDLTGQVAYQCVLQQAIPISIGAINQSWDNDSIHKMNITFAYKRLVHIAHGDAGIQHYGGSIPIGANGPNGPPGLLSTITSTLSRAFDARTLAAGFGGGIIAGAQGSATKGLGGITGKLRLPGF